MKHGKQPSKEEIKSLISNMTMTQFKDWYNTTFGPYMDKGLSRVIPRTAEEALRKAGYEGPFEGPGITTPLESADQLQGLNENIFRRIGNAISSFFGTVLTLVYVLPIIVLGPLISIISIGFAWALAQFDLTGEFGVMGYQGPEGDDYLSDREDDNPELFGPQGTMPGLGITENKKSQLQERFQKLAGIKKNK